MITAGYSQKSLADKLGIAPAMEAVVLGAPPRYKQKLGKLPAGAKLTAQLSADHVFIQYFTAEYAELVNTFPGLKHALLKNGHLWVCWPKKGSGKKTDLSETIVRETGLHNGLVDTKVIAIDETWSGLKFVYRLKDR